MRNGDAGYVAVKWFPISKSAGPSSSNVDTQASTGGLSPTCARRLQRFAWRTIQWVSLSIVAGTPSFSGTGTRGANAPNPASTTNVPSFSGTVRNMCVRAISVRGLNTVTRANWRIG